MIAALGPTRRCRECGTTVSQRAARFCSRCGSQLPEPTPASRGRRIPRTTATVLVTIGLVAGGLLVGPSVAQTSLDRLGTFSGPDTEVTFDAGLDVLDARPRTPTTAEIEDVRAAWDDQPLRCRPRGCEAWRTVVEDLRVVGPTNDGGVALVDGDRLRLLDAATGEERAEHPLETVPPATLDGGDERKAVIADDRLMVIEPDGSVVGMDLEGRRRWHYEPAGFLHATSIEAAGDRVVLGITRPASPIGASVVLLDASDGEVVGSSPGRLRRLRAQATVLETVTSIGTPRRCTTLDGLRTCWDDTDIAPHARSVPDDLLVIGERRREDDDILVDIGSVQDRDRIDGQVRSLVATDAGRVALVDRHDGTTFTVGVTDDGNVSWRSTLPSQLWGRLRLSVDTDGSAVAYDRQRPYLRVDPASGQLDVVETGAAPDPTSEASGMYVSDEGVLVQRVDELSPDEPEVIVDGGAFRAVAADPLVITDGRSLLALTAPTDARR